MPKVYTKSVTELATEPGSSLGSFPLLTIQNKMLMTKGKDSCEGKELVCERLGGRAMLFHGTWGMISSDRNESTNCFFIPRLKSKLSLQGPRPAHLNLKLPLQAK